MKSTILFVLNLLAFFWQIIPSRIRLMIFTSLFLVESRGKKPSYGLKHLFNIQDQLSWVINERAMAYGSGVHPKHKLTSYHDFFIDNICNGQKVLDVGCGYGAVARSIALALKDSRVLGIDLNSKNIAKATSVINPKNLAFIEADASKFKFNEIFDVVVLSNVLEHIVNRVDFIKSLKISSGAKKFLIRVPLFERDWEMPMRRELGVNYFSDNDHKIEHSFKEFKSEVEMADFKITNYQTLWGEIWAVCDCRNF